MLLRSLVPAMQAEAPTLDRDARFPAGALDQLRRSGALQETRTDRIAEALITIGEGNLSVGRLAEAHVNAVHLIRLYGTPEQVEWAASEQDLFGLWVTDPPSGGLSMRAASRGIRLDGAKQFCSGAGHVTAALVTARDPDGVARMLILRLGRGEVVTPLPAALHGMRAAVTGQVDFSGCVAPADAILGEPGDYLREPAFSTGAWRGSAVACGGLVALVDHAVRSMSQSGRADSLLAKERLGQIFIARETALHWVSAAARVAEEESVDVGRRIATVGLARIAVETACLDAIRLVQRSIGLSAFRQGTLIELICRDLATYLRQPAPDEVLTEAAGWFAEHPETRT